MQTLDWIHGKDPKAYIKVRQKSLKENFFGSAPAPFIGHYNYPNVNVGILSPGMHVEEAFQYDSPRHWSKKNFSINSIAAMRQELINSRFKAHIKSSSKMLALSQEIGIASKPAEVEINLAKKPNLGFFSDSMAAPTGPRAEIKQAKITSNTKIKRAVEKTVDDTDLKSAEGLKYLYKKGFEESYLSRILSVGALGIGNNRKLVPTRWSITATDDVIGKQLHKQIDYNPESNIEVRFGGHLGNYFLVMFLPGPWSFELFEIAVEMSNTKLYYSTDYEFYKGRKDYASETVGGYYATRLSVLEKLNEMKRKSSVLVLRFITKEYNTPLGVWVVREAVRKAMTAKPIEFGEEKLALNYIEIFSKKKFGLDVSPLKKRSKLLDFRHRQKSIISYF